MKASFPPPLQPPLPLQHFLLAWERRVPAVDWWSGLLAGSAVLYGVLKTFGEPRSGPLADSPGLEIAVEVLAGAALLLRRRHVFAVLATVMAADVLTHAPLALAVATGSLGFLHKGRKRVLVGWAVAAAVTHAAAVLLGDPDPDFDAITGVLTHVVIPVLFGFHTQVHQGLIRSLTARAEQARYERELLTGRVRSEERARIARELHDIVANRVGQMVLCAGALELTTTDRAARQRAEEIRTAGRETLRELRELLGVIRTASPDAAAPQRTLEDLDQLLERCGEASGTSVERRGLTGGALRELPRTVQFTAYRVVQEALTNALRHAPGSPVRVETRWARHDGPALRVTVHNAAAAGAPAPAGPGGDPSGGGGGYGLLGIRERVKLLGGTVTHGVQPDGGFAVTAILPTTRAPYRSIHVRPAKEEGPR
ncbi:sensor histidine kinase [Streptomyces sp. NPDC056773]|uniref:sensor histidine kinase n=1 Tax=unclassified Streptomyces TaxID=2593676 RepID=UPI0036CB51E7